MCGVLIGWENINVGCYVKYVLYIIIQYTLLINYFIII